MPITISELPKSTIGVYRFRPASLVFPAEWTVSYLGGTDIEQWATERAAEDPTAIVFFL
jgi:hypothetical protein